MTALPEVLEKLEPCPMCGGEAHLERQGHVACKTGWPCVHTAYFNSGTPEEQNAAAIRAWNTRPALLRDAGDSARMDYIERTFRGMSNGERYLPLVMGWGKSRNGRTLREAIDKHMEKEGPLTGVTFVERDMPPGVLAELRTPNDRVTIVDDDTAMHAPGGAGGGE